jgi:hypothetical protein
MPRHLKDKDLTVLSRLTKRDLIGQLGNVRRMAESQPGEPTRDWKVRVARSYGAQECICEVQTVGDTAYICPVQMDDKVVALMSRILDREMEALDLERLRNDLERSAATQVAIGWPANKTSGCASAVVRCLAVRKGEYVTTFLFPGPMDIDRVNEELKEYCAAHGCSVLKDGGDCERCGKMMECQVLKDAEREVRRRRGIDNGEED